MLSSRREFLKTTTSMSAAMAFGTLPRLPSTSKRLLILGGTGFIGPHMVRYAVDRGHQVTIFTRGNSKVHLPNGVEQLIGDRNDDHAALQGRTWDIVLDNNAQDYRWVAASTSLLKHSVDHYILVSSISAYDLNSFGWTHSDQILMEPKVDEGYPRIESPVGWNYGDEAPYGLMKTLSEDIVHNSFPGKNTVVRPGLIAGPEDPTGRFTYWPVRLAEGGEVLAPGNPKHSNQVIDQRDLTEWIIRLAEDQVVGDFNATGPATRMSMESMLNRIGTATDGSYKLTWVPEYFLEAEGLSPWRDIPTWIPGDPLMLVDINRAIAAGLTFRPLRLTSKDTLKWYETRPKKERFNPLFGMSRERERKVLKAWSATTK